MKKLLAVLAAATAISGTAHADGIKEFNLGILGGENAQDRMNSNECYRAKLEEAMNSIVNFRCAKDFRAD